MKHLLNLSLALVFALVAQRSAAQDTFSMVAVDTLTGEVGASGASCISFNPLGGFINRLVPGVGALTCQSFVSTINRDYALALMQSGKPPQEILDSLYANDGGNTPENRQNLAVTLLDGGAAFTGNNCMPYASHIVGPNYVIAGNILAGQYILDSMEARFLAEPGDLAHKLMAALQGANVVGADTRCNQYGTSSLSAYLRVAQPTDSVEAYSLDLNLAVNPLGTIYEPIDSLQNLFDELFPPVSRPEPLEKPEISIYPQPAGDYVMVEGSFDGEIQLSDALGRVVAVSRTDAGQRRVRLDLGGLPSGMYFLRLERSQVRVLKQ